MTHLDSYGLPLQIGGLPGKSTTQATHALLAVHAYAKKRKLNVAFLFLDIQNAFYKVLREHLVEHKSTADLRALFDNLQLPEHTYHEFVDLIAQQNAPDAAGVSSHLQAMIKQFLRATWFVVADCPTITRTTRGTRPGDSLADITFSFVMAKILRNFFQYHYGDDVPELYWNGLHVPWDGGEGHLPVGPISPIWADDVAVALMHRDVDKLVLMVKDVATHVFELLSLAGMQPNLKPTKTEVLLALRGKGAHNQLRKLMQDGCALHLNSLFDFPPLRVVGTYKHLGTCMTTGATLNLEIRTKIAMAHSIITKYRTQIFGCRKLLLQKKIQLFRSLVMSVVLHNAGAWHLLTVRESQKYEKGVYGLYSRIARLHWKQPDAHWDRMDLCVVLGADQPQYVLRSTRLRYLQHLVRTGQPQLWALLQQDPDWWQMIYDDLDWLFS